MNTDTVNQYPRIEESGFAGEVYLSAMRRLYPKAGDFMDACLAGSVSVLIAFFALLVSPQTRHWFIVPCLLAATLTGRDVVAWLRGKMDVFDPKAAVSALMYNGFFIAPLLFIAYGGVNERTYWDLTWRLDSQMAWREWIGYFSCYGLFLIPIYYAGERLGCAGKSRWARTKTWSMPKGMSLFLGFMLAVSVLAWCVYYFRMGGVQGIDEVRYKVSSKRLGTGPLLVLAGSAPFILALGIVVLRGSWRKSKGGGLPAMMVILVVVVIQLVMLGALGQRSKLVFAGISGVALIHYFWRPFRRKELLIAMIPAFFLLQAYSLYKDYGAEVLNRFGKAPVAKSYELGLRRSLPGMLVGDLARTSRQTALFHVALTEPGAYDLALGRTYVYGVIGPIPHWIWPRGYRPVEWKKGRYGWQIAKGRGTWDQYLMVMPNVAQYGLIGEAILNFGVLGPVVMMPLLGFIVGRLRRLHCSLSPGDSRLAVTSLLIPVAMFGFLGDMDNVVMSSFIYIALVPVVCIAIISKRRTSGSILDPQWELAVG